MSEGFYWFRYDSEKDSQREVDQLSPASYQALHRLWLLSMQIGPLPDDVEWLRSKTRCQRRDVAAALKADFRLDGGKWISDWLEDQRAGAERRHRQRVKAGRASGDSRGKKDEPDPDAPPVL